jgi:flagellum-specific peptidoglycan hydrolase FlgJ
VNGNEQLIGTTEYHTTPNFKYPVINKIIKVAPNRWKYSIMDYFRKYKSPAESFADHGRFLRKNKRYAKAFNFTDPREFAREIAAAGYATDPDYNKKLNTVITMIERSVRELYNT